MSALIELDRERLEALLAELDRRLKARGVAAGVYVVGGAAIALTIASRRVTVDVDALATHEAVYDEAALLAADHGLPPTWLNPAAAPWIPPRPHVERPSRPGLQIDVAPPEHLLAMKIGALRDRDYPDIAALASLLGLDSAPASVFEDLLRDAYGDDELLETVLGVRRDEDLDAEVSARAEAVRRIIGHFAE